MKIRFKLTEKKTTALDLRTLTKVSTNFKLIEMMKKFQLNLLEYATLLYTHTFHLRLHNNLLREYE